MDLTISGDHELDRTYQLLFSRVNQINLKNNGEFPHIIPILLGGYALYKYYPKKILNHPLLKTEDIDFKFILNSRDNPEYSTFKDFLRRELQRVMIIQNFSGLLYFFRPGLKYQISIKEDHGFPPTYFNYESGYLDISIHNEYNSLNLFLEFDESSTMDNGAILNVSNVPIEVIRGSVLSQNEIPSPYHYFPSEEFIDFNTIHLYVLIDSLIREYSLREDKYNVRLFSRLIKTSKIMARLMILLSKGYNSNQGHRKKYDLFDHFEKLLSEFQKYCREASDVDQPYIIASFLSNEAIKFKIIIDSIRDNIRTSPELLDIYNFLMIKFQSQGIPPFVPATRSSSTSLNLPRLTRKLGIQGSTSSFPPHPLSRPSSFPTPTPHPSQIQNLSRVLESNRLRLLEARQSGGGNPIFHNERDYLIYLLGKDFVYLDDDSEKEKERYYESLLFLEFNNQLFDIINKMNKEKKRKVKPRSLKITGIRTGKRSGMIGSQPISVRAGGGDVSRKTNKKSRKINKNKKIKGK